MSDDGDADGNADGDADVDTLLVLLAVPNSDMVVPLSVAVPCPLVLRVLLLLL